MQNLKEQRVCIISMNKKPQRSVFFSAEAQRHRENKLIEKWNIIN